MSVQHKLRCLKCYKADWAKYEVWGHLKHITWRNIEVFYNTVNSVKCVCKNCGHTYVSSSAAAFMALRAKSVNS
jgi:hypothetical protein